MYHSHPVFLCCDQHCLLHIGQTLKYSWVYQLLGSQLHFVQISVLLGRNDKTRDDGVNQRGSAMQSDDEAIHPIRPVRVQGKLEDGLFA